MTSGKHRARGRRGFTLIEIITAVAVLALVASIALPNYKSSVFRAQRVEAVVNLESMNIAQASYMGSNDVYASDFSVLDFDSEGQQTSARVFSGRRYTYTLSQPWGDHSWMCTATAELDGDDWPDTLVAFEEP